MLVVLSTLRPHEQLCQEAKSFDVLLNTYCFRNSLAIAHFNLDLSIKVCVVQSGEDEASSFYIVTAGRIKLIRYLNSGKVSTFEIFRLTKTLAEISLSSNIYPCTAIANLAKFRFSLQVNIAAPEIENIIFGQENYVLSCL